MCRYHFLLLLFFSFKISQETKAQEPLHYFFRHITQADGLLHNEIFSITQDGKGFIWIATSNGLQQYDGSRFVYYPDILSDPSEGYSFDADMYVDKKNNLLWVSKNQVLEKMDLNKKSFTVYHPKKTSLDTSFVFDLYKGAQNEQWLLNDKAVYSYNSASKSKLLYSIAVRPSTTNQSSFLATEATSGNTWYSMGKQLYLFNKKNKTVYSADFNPGHHPLLDWLHNEPQRKSPRFVMTDSKQNIWITTWEDLFYKYDFAKKKVITYSLSAIKKKRGR